MDIIKSILHVFKKSDNAFKIMHPETESAQITDWHQGIVNTLASTGLSSLVNVLSSDSLLALLIKKVFDAAGVKYSTGQNGYVCLGDFFGDVIVQWGTIQLKNGKGKLILPISANNIACILQHNGVTPQYNGIDNLSTIYSSLNSDEEIGFIAITK